MYCQFWMTRCNPDHFRPKGHFRLHWGRQPKFFPKFFWKIKKYIYFFHKYEKYIKNIYFTSIGAPWQSWLNFPVEMFSTCKTPLDSAQIMRLLLRGKNRQKITKTPRGKRPSAEKNVKNIVKLNRRDTYWQTICVQSFSRVKFITICSVNWNIQKQWIKKAVTRFK